MLAAYRSTPVRAFTTAAPPRINICRRPLCQQEQARKAGSTAGDNHCVSDYGTLAVQSEGRCGHVLWDDV